MKRIKVGIIGQGRSGRNIHRHLFECCPELQARFDVVAVADPIPERTAPVNPGANPECRQYADYKEMLEDKNIELSFALQEKKIILQENRVKDRLLESRRSLEQSKRSRIENSGEANHQDDALLKSQ